MTATAEARELCADPEFQYHVRAKTEEWAVDRICIRCNVDSLDQLDHEPGPAGEWERMRQAFYAWRDARMEA